MNNNTKLPWIAQWLCMTQKQVLDKFQGIPGSFSDGLGQERFVYVDGKRNDKVLLVAHADTVWDWLEKGDDSRIGLLYEKGVLSSAKQHSTYEIKYHIKKNKYKTVTRTGAGIGADDRAGCGIVWKLRNLGHSLLITSGEEKGCIATRRIMRSPYWQNKIAEHQFAVEFDRRSDNDIVFYDVATNEFAQYVAKETGYKAAPGSVTDISHLCERICGVNMSVGYYDEHSCEERLVLKEFERTLTTAYKWLSQKDLPKFPFIRENMFHCSYRLNALYDYGDEYLFGHIEKNAHNFTPNLPIKSSNNTINLLDLRKEKGSIQCPHCRNKMQQEAWHRVMFKCETCGKDTVL